jgi:hypothetical protein
MRCRPKPSTLHRVCLSKPSTLNRASPSQAEDDEERSIRLNPKPQTLKLKTANRTPSPHRPLTRPEEEKKDEGKINKKINKYKYNARTGGRKRKKIKAIYAQTQTEHKGLRLAQG